MKLSIVTLGLWNVNENAGVNTLLPAGGLVDFEDGVINGRLHHFFQRDGRFKGPILFVGRARKIDPVFPLTEFFQALIQRKPVLKQLDAENGRAFGKLFQRAADIKIRFLEKRQKFLFFSIGFLMYMILANLYWEFKFLRLPTGT